jgi:hypothetical protein
MNGTDSSCTFIKEAIKFLENNQNPEAIVHLNAAQENLPRNPMSPFDEVEELIKEAIKFLENNQNPEAIVHLNAAQEKLGCK